ncbi:hypothetical protein RS85_00902 [Microbacterium sp. SA39]|nr:hypothetical protein RS85_00902 [Microbacterium sp. SA39]
MRGNVLPDVAAQIQAVFDAYGNPKTDGAPQPGVQFEDSEGAGAGYGPGAGNDAGSGAGWPSDDDAAGNATDAGSGTTAGTGFGATGGANAAGDKAFASGGDFPPDGFTRSEGAVPPDEPEPPDRRSAGQKRHDALAAAFSIAARHKEMPSLGGASPTLVVHVDAKDLAAGRGWATLAGSQSPIPLHVAAHTACTGTIQRVLFDEGRIVGISVTDRVFTVHQRRAIIARDKECLIPGCHVPASWCEIHHVTEHARGGPTHTDNGVPLCWWHHRSLDTSGWEIRMNNGVPEIRGPAWWDPHGHWRTPRPSIPRHLATA